ncbi:hypothetical protein ACFQZ4_23970 [Catellatospora coxensis]
MRVIARKGYMEARRISTGAVLATAERSNGHDDSEWIGWAIRAAGRRPEVVIATEAARLILLAFAAGAVTAAGYQLLLRDRADASVRVELTSADEHWTYPQARDLLLGLESKIPAKLVRTTRYLAIEPVRA